MKHAEKRMWWRMYGNSKPNNNFVIHIVNNKFKILTLNTVDYVLPIAHSCKHVYVKLCQHNNVYKMAKCKSKKHARRLKSQTAMGADRNGQICRPINTNNQHSDSEPTTFQNAR